MTDYTPTLKQFPSLLLRQRFIDIIVDPISKTGVRCFYISEDGEVRIMSPLGFELNNPKVISVTNEEATQLLSGGLADHCAQAFTFFGWPRILDDLTDVRQTLLNHAFVEKANRLECLSMYECTSNYVAFLI